MAYNLELAKRISTIIGNGHMLEEKKMFGGVGAKLYEKVLAEQNCSVFDITGRPMTGRVMVDEEGSTDQNDLENWVSPGVRSASALPPKLT